MKNANEDQQRLYDIIKKVDYCMFTTHTGRTLRSRPMSTIVRDSGEIAMLSDMRGGKDEEISKNKDVLLSYSDGGKLFASVSGKAQMSTDRALIRELWNPGAQAFWPDGPDDPDVYVILVQPSEGEYWESSGGVISGIKFAYALATGTEPDAGENAKVKLKVVKG